MNTLLTAITPVAPYHRHLLPDAARSVAGQTVPCLHLTAIDEDGSGPGAMRNRLLAEVETPYVTFLDADDLLEPDFAAVLLGAARPRRYVYSGWYQGLRAIEPPEHAWCEGTWHVVTALVATEDARAVGGFDETLDGMEDTDFYARLLAHGVCGIRVNRPLVHYSKYGQRARTIHNNGDVDRLRALMRARYGQNLMACCGQPAEPRDVTPVGARLDGDVLAEAQWHGNRRMRGRATGRNYGRLAYPQQAWVDRRDVKAAPALWREVSHA